jgi:hypothetical protein
LPIRDHQPLVNLLRQKKKKSLKNHFAHKNQLIQQRAQEILSNLDSSGLNLNLATMASKQDVSQKADPSTLLAKAYMVKAIWNLHQATLTHQNQIQDHQPSCTWRERHCKIHQATLAHQNNLECGSE